MAVEQKNAMGQSEMQSRFVEFILMHTQNILFLLGKLPTPDGRAPQVNLEFAKVLVDQLEMIETKTQGNLSPEESEVLKNALANVRLAFVETARGTSNPAPPPIAPASTDSETKFSTPPASSEDREKEDDEENKKRFTKKYG